MYADLVHEERHADAAAHRPGLVRVLFPLLVPVNALGSSFHALLEAVAVVGDSIGSDKSRRDAVLHAELQRIESALIADIIRKSIREECRLGNTVGTHCSGNRRRGVYGIRIRLAAVFFMEDILEVRRHSGCDGMAVGRIRALVGVDESLTREQLAVLCRQGSQNALGSMAGTGHGDALFPGELQTYRPSAALDRQPCVERLIQDVLLVAESAADVGLDHTDLAHRPAKGLGDHAAHDMRDLG